VIFAGFSADAIAERLAASQSKWVFTSDEGLRGGKTLPLKSICDAAMGKKVCEGVVEKCFVWERTGGKCNWDDQRDVKFGELADSQRWVL
jgi:acetyl-CoA synthetase